MDYDKTLAAAGGKEVLKEALIDAILQVRLGQKYVLAQARPVPYVSVLFAVVPSQSRGKKCYGWTRS